MGKTVTAGLALILVPVLIIVVLLVARPESSLTPGISGLCGVGETGQKVNGDLPGIGEWSAEQVHNAVAIMNAGADLGLSRRDQEIAVTTAIGESALRVLDYGDDVGPDSRGLFQQRDNGAWGSYADRMDPHTSATNFFKALMKVNGRESLSYTEAAHRVQGNADPQHYARFEADARALVATILKESGGVLPSDAGGADTALCAVAGSGEGIPDQATLGQPSAEIACPEGSTDLGVFDGAYEGARIPIRLCSITGTVCFGSDCRPGELGGKARGEVVISSRFAPYFMAWLETVRAAGKNPTFSSSFRSWETQARISRGGSNSNAALNGRSHHQTGAAVDVSGLPGSYNKFRCTGKTPDGACMTGGDLWPVLHQAGLQHGLTVHDQEFWHFEFILSGTSRGRTNPFIH